MAKKKGGRTSDRRRKRVPHYELTHGTVLAAALTMFPTSNFRSLH